MPELLSGSSFVTGAGAGIGQAAAYALVKHGSSKIAIGDINFKSLETTVAELKALNPDVEVLPLHLDVRSETSVDEAIRQIVAAFGRIDIAINNAGISGPLGLSTDTAFADYKNLMDVNLDGVWLCGRAEARQMLKQDYIGNDHRKTRGVIVNIASMFGVIGMWSKTPAIPYAAAKHAVVGLTKSEANCFADRGIRFNALCPGFVETALTKEALAAGHMNEYIQKTPMKRLAQVAEIGDCVAFLASPMSSFMTGAAMVVDGGFSSA